MANQTGKLIVIDGIDGSGKATQTKLLIERLEKAGYGTATMDFPQYEQNFFGRMVRQYLNGAFGDPTTVNPRLASLLYAADRWESSATIKKWLADGQVVVLDRYYTSNLIHQAAKLSDDEVDGFITWLQEMELGAFGIPRPDGVIYLEVAPEVAFELIRQRGQGYDGHDKLEFMRRAAERCQTMATRFGWWTIHCSQDEKMLSREEIAAHVWHHTQAILKPH